MPSSTSSSEPLDPGTPKRRRFLRFAALLLVGVSIVFLGAELGARVWLPRSSQIERRTEREIDEALRLRDDRAILLVGNSLLGTGVDMPVLNDRLKPDRTAHRLYVENTRYFDWYYGLHYLFDAGCRPNTVVVVFSVRQLLANSVRGEYMVHRLARWRDIHRLAHDVGYDLTQTSNLYMARGSQFYSSRAEIRSWLLGRAIPRFEDLRRDLTPPSVPFPPDDEALATLVQRLQDLHALAEGYGVKLAVAVPPTLAEDGREELAKQAASRSGVPCLVPLPAAQTTKADFEADAAHLDKAGAVRFSRALAEELKGEQGFP